MAKKKNEFERIADTSSSYERIGSDEISQLLGAKADSKMPSRGGSPFSFWALRSRLLSELVSTGGRPGRKEAVERKKIPMTESEWALLDEITRILNIRGVKATAGQVAGILLNQSMTEVLKRLDRVAPTKSAGAGPGRQLSDTELEEKVESILAAAASAESHLQELRPVALELLRRMSSDDEGEADEE
jgi:hypothetical protein